MSPTHFCKQCERPFTPKRPHQKYDDQECRYQGWIEQQIRAALQCVEEHPLAEARASQESSDLKSKLSQIIYEGIIDRLKQGPVHADDLEPLFPPEVRDVCRRLVGAQFGSLASRRYIFEKERRKSDVPSRKGAKSGVYEFTRVGREKLTAGVDVTTASEERSRIAPPVPVGRGGVDPGGARPTGAPTSKESGSDTDPAVPSASDQSSPVAKSTSHDEVTGETLSLLPEPAPEVWAA